MLKLICGPSGSGKSRTLAGMIRSDVENRRRCYLLVPEQQAYISERDMPSLLPPDAGLYFEVVHFSGLAEDVFRKYGGVVKPSINAGIQTLLMWDTLRELSSKQTLNHFGKSAGTDLTLVGLMLQTVAELRAGGISSDDLENAAKHPDAGTELRDKLNDIALVDAMFSAKLKDSFGEDPSDRLVRLAKLLREHDFFAGANVYVDSFTSFTVPEYDVLREILRQAQNVTVALCADGFSSSLPHFAPTVKTARQLTKLASEADSEIKKTVLPADPSARPAEIVTLERALWRFGGRDEIPANTGAVTAVRASNLYEEAECVAITILGWVQNGMHYGDIAVFVRDPEVYRGVLDAALERHGIPCFLSERTDLSVKPVARLILSALRAISRNYRASDLITMLKTGLCGVDPRDAALFEEYCETWHISGSRFADDVWNMNPDGFTTERSARGEEILAAANRVRKALMDPLLAFAADLRQSERLLERCRALYDYLGRLNVAAQLSERAKAELRAGARRDAGETVRLYRAITDILTSLSQVMPDTELTVDEFFTALSLLFSNSDLGSVPNVHDCVMIGSAATMRVENLRAAMLLGLCEGEFPRAIDGSGLLNEDEKAKLETLGVTMQTREAMQSAEELFYVYRAMTKPTEKLYLSAPLLETNGSARTPSLAFSRALRLLDREPEVFDLSELRGALGLSAAISNETVRYGKTRPAGTSICLSATSIENYQLCPYRFFVTQDLHLREVKDSMMHYSDDGTFLHYIFEKYVKYGMEHGGDFATDEATREKITDDVIDQYLTAVCPIPPEQLDSRLVHQFARLRKLALKMLENIEGELLASRFRPAHLEQVIGKSDGVPSPVFPLGDGSEVSLKGKIDRVDILEEGGQSYVRVVDYKASKKQFDPKLVATGRNLQLVLYLAAYLKSGSDLTGAGAEYLFADSSKDAVSVGRSGFRLADDVIETAIDNTVDRKYAKDLKPMNDDMIRQLIETDLESAVKSTAKRILSGEAQRTPSEEACKYCPIIGYCDRACKSKDWS